MLTQANRLSIVGFVVALSLSLSVVRDAWAGELRETRFTVVDSSSTSWVARGYSDYTVSPDNGWSFSPSRNFDNGVGLNIAGPALPGTTVDYWNLEFAAPFDALITPGFYADFQRYPFQDSNRPGLSFSSTGRLDNRASGFFEVFEATYDIGDQVLSFSADFTHFGETNPDNWAQVEVRYNALIPEPGSFPLAVMGAVALLAVGWWRRKRAA